MTSSELIKNIKNNYIAIYGAGYAAENFYTALKIKNLDHKVKYFIVSELPKGRNNIQGVSIRIFRDEIELIKKDMYI